MLSLVVLTMGIIVLLGLVGFAFNGFLFQRSQSQYKADAVAMSSASAINAGDRVGQMNELEGSCRELVYVSRQNEDQCNHSEELGSCSPLYTQLLQEAHTGQRLLEQERRNQIFLIRKDIEQRALQYNGSLAQANVFNLLGLQTREPRITRIDVGHATRMESSVQSLNAISDLAAIDREQGCVNPVSNLFKGELDARLPGIDKALSFKMCSLPAYIDGTCAPPRNINPDRFMRSASVFENGRKTLSDVDQIPTAVQVFCSMDTSFGRNHENHADVGLVSTAVTSGALVGAH